MGARRAHRRPGSARGRRAAVRRRRRRRRHARPSTSRAHASSCRARRSCCPASARRAGGSRTSRRRSPRARRRARHRFAVDRPRPRAARRRAGRRGARGGRAPARAGVGARRERPQQALSCSRDVFPAPRRAGWRPSHSSSRSRRSAIVVTLERRARTIRRGDVVARRRRLADGRRDVDRRRRPRRGTRRPRPTSAPAGDLHRQGRRHARDDRRGDRASRWPSSQELNPDARPAEPHRRRQHPPAAMRRARPDRPRRARSARPRPRAAQTGAPTCSAPSAIVVEASTGDVAFQRKPEPAALDRLDDEAHDRAAHASRARRSTTCSPPRRTRRGPAESVVGLRAGERMTVRDLLARAHARQRQRRRGDARGGHQRVGAGVRRRDERARQGARACATRRYANPVGLDAGPQPLVGARPRAAWRSCCAATSSCARPSTCRARRSPAARAAASVINRNTLVRNVDEVDGVKTGRTNQAGYVLVGSADAQRRHGRQRGARRAERGRARRRHARAAALRPRAATGARRSSSAARRSPAPT